MMLMKSLLTKRLQQKGVKMGDQLQLNGSERLYQVVGFTEDNSFFTQPVIFMALDDFRELKYGSSLVKNISALVVKNDQKIEEAGLSQLSMGELIENIPGYQAQVLTFSFMIGAMVLITFLVLGIFMYIITYKRRIFMVLCAPKELPVERLLLLFSGRFSSCPLWE